MLKKFYEKIYKGFRCPRCKERFKTEKELEDHLFENNKCKTIANMFLAAGGLKIKFAK